MQPQNKNPRLQPKGPQSGVQGIALLFERFTAIQRVDLAHALFFCHETERCLQVCEEALHSFPEESMLHVYAGDSLRELKRYEEAFPHWEAAVRLDDKFLDAMFSMAFCRGDMGQFDKAADIWDDIARRLEMRGLEIEAQWPRNMAEKCRAQVK